MCKTWRTTCVSLLVLGPFLSACGGDDASATQSSTTSSAPSSGVYGQPADPDAPEPTDVATDSPAAPASPSTSTTTATAPAPGPGSAARGSVDVLVTYSGWIDGTSAVEVGAYVVGVAESDGSCTLTLTSGTDSRTAFVAGEGEASTTSCPTMSVDGAELSSGKWEAVVSYESPSSAGTSAPVEIRVP